MRTRGGIVDQSEYDIQDREAAFLEYVQQKLAEIRKYSQLGKDGMLTFFDLNRALMEYQNTNLTLIAMHSIARNEFKRSEEEYEDWYADKYIQVREIENPKSVSPGKWASQKEIEYIVRTKFSEEFKQKKHELNMKEAQISFLRRLTESWGQQNFILSNLSKNLQSEVAGLGISKD